MTQVPCKLCCVSFNIGRIRRPDEPFSAAYGGEQNYELDVNGQVIDSFIATGYCYRSDPCPSSAGCRDIQREKPTVPPKSTVPRGSDKDDLDDDFDEEGDQDFIYESEEDNDSSGYQSDDFAIEIEQNDERDSAMEDDDGASSYETSDGDIEHAEQHEVSEHIVSNDHDGSSNKSFEEDERIEHVAGPGCQHGSGYSGFAISTQEMIGCTTLQCLVRKGFDWKPEIDDQDFELSGDYCLSGLSGYMPSRGGGYGPDIIPSRHSIEDLYPDSMYLDPDVSTICRVDVTIGYI